MKNNYKDFLHILDIAKEFKAQSIKVFNFSAQGRGFENRNCLKLSTKEQKEILDEIKKVLDEKKIPIDFGGEFEGLNTKCSVGKKIVITFNGDVLPCLGLRSNTSFVLGNYRKENMSELIEKLEKISSDTCLCSTTKNNKSTR
jgi:MoaA/NifB/PqqE/SkfB family radical SAM enzyme